MNIAMFTNTYLPHVGGVANSVHSFVRSFEDGGHNCLVVAPKFKGAEVSDEKVLRVQAIKEFNGTDFSVRLPEPLRISERMQEFRPDILHSHHPFLLGDSALRVSRRRGIPVVFTHHTLYERYTHYLPVKLEGMERLASLLATEYANLCDHVIAPSESIARLLRERGVTTPITPLPTGIDPRQFAAGDRERGRSRFDVQGKGPVIGHVGRLAEEKNLRYLATAVLRFLELNHEARFLLVGRGPMEKELRETIRASSAAQRVRFAGALGGKELADAYAAMDAFAFASTSETQGMVLAEAMAAGTPVVALDAPGVREVVEDGYNGRLLPQKSNEADFAMALSTVTGKEAKAPLREHALQTSSRFSRQRCADQLLAVYRDLRKRDLNTRPLPGKRDSDFETISRRIELEWDLLAKRLAAFFAALSLGE
ncbi:MAG: glycosyltransferase [Verrucomicrobia bacterium]|jgi:glycosyltransferase involved in cell wall biosynthesis|nr:glycosyltransferase [Verrucomicrobiota bacterium]